MKITSILSYLIKLNAPSKAGINATKCSPLLACARKDWVFYYFIPCIVYCFTQLSPDTSCFVSSVSFVIYFLLRSLSKSLTSKESFSFW